MKNKRVAKMIKGPNGNWSSRFIFEKRYQKTAITELKNKMKTIP